MNIFRRTYTSVQRPYFYLWKKAFRDTVCRNKKKKEKRDKILHLKKKYSNKILSALKNFFAVIALVKILVLKLEGIFVIWNAKHCSEIADAWAERQCGTATKICRRRRQNKKQKKTPKCQRKEKHLICTSFNFCYEQMLPLQADMKTRTKKT